MQEVRNVINSIEISFNLTIRIVTPKVRQFSTWIVRINLKIVSRVEMPHSALELIKKRNHS